MVSTKGKNSSLKCQYVFSKPVQNLHENRMFDTINISTGISIKIEYIIEKKKE